MANANIPGTQQLLTKNPNTPVTYGDLQTMIRYILDLGGIVGTGTNILVFTGTDFAGTASFTNAIFTGTPDVDFAISSGDVLKNIVDYTHAGTTITLTSGIPAVDEKFFAIKK